MKKIISFLCLALLAICTSTVSADVCLTNSSTMTETATALQFGFRNLGINSNVNNVDWFEHSLNGTVLKNVDFVASEGFTDGNSIGGTNGMGAQSEWVATDTAGRGIASAPGSNWVRAEDFTSANVVVGDTISSRMFVSVDYGQNGTIGRMGWADQALHTGQNIPGALSRDYSVSDANGGTFSFDGMSIDSSDGYSHGDFVEIRLDVTLNDTSGNWTYTSTLKFVEAVPEPGSASLGLVFLIGLVAKRRRK